MATTYDETTGEKKEKQSQFLVITASSLGTIFEWYDFYLYGLLASIISAQFFSGVNETTGFIFALAAFAAGFAVRPFGAIFFGRIGDMVGRKNTFLVTMGLMGMSTFVVGLLPSYASIGVLAPIMLIVMRLIQGLALGGEYGGAATYVAEHAPDDGNAWFVCGALGGDWNTHLSWRRCVQRMGLARAVPRLNCATRRFDVDPHAIGRKPRLSENEG
jgi:MFS family permease